MLRKSMPIPLAERSLSRRRFLTMAGTVALAAGAVGATPWRLARAAGESDAMVLQTVLGSVNGAAVEWALPHEHLYVDFHGPADPAYMDVDWADVTGAVVNSLMEVNAQGVNLLVDWTNIGVGRNALLLRSASRQTDVHIVCATGIYKSLVPPALANKSVEQIARRFVDDLTLGIDDTGIRAGFIKIATTEAGPTETDAVIHRAAAIAAREVGCTITLHSPHAAATKAVVATLEKEGFDLKRFVWGHSQPSSSEDHKAMAERGAMVQFDAISADSDPFFNGPTDDESMLKRIEAMIAAGYGDRVIVSIDASVFVHPPKWQYDRDNTYMYRYFKPKMEERLGADATRQILRDNVIRAFRRGDKVT